MSDADYNGNVYVVTFLKDINQVVSPLKLTQVITDQSAVGRTVEYTEPSVTDIPVYNVDGTVSGVMNGDDASVVSATGGCMSVVVNPARLDTGALLVKSYKGSVVVVHYDLKDMKMLRHTVLLPQVNDVEVDHETAGKLRVDANHGFIYAFVAMTKEVQVAVETMHNLAHNSVIQFPEHAGSNTTVHVLFKIDSGSGVILGIKQISVYESITTEHLIDMDIYADPKTFTTTMHAIGTVPMDKSNKFLYLRYDGIEKMESTVRLDPDFFSVFNFSGNIAPIPKNIVAKDDSTAVISGGSSPAIFHHSNAFLREYDSKAGQSYGIAWSAKSDLFANAIQIVDGKIYYVQQRGDPNALTTSLDVKWCGPYNPNPPNPPNPPPKKPLNYRKLIVGLSLGLSVPFISIIVLAVCAVALFKVMRKGDDIERTRLM